MFLKVFYPQTLFLYLYIKLNYMKVNLIEYLRLGYKIEDLDLDQTFTIKGDKNDGIIVESIKMGKELCNVTFIKGHKTYHPMWIETVIK